MRLEGEEKKSAYVTCLNINRASFDAEEVAPDGVFLQNYDGGEVFVARSLSDSGIVLGIVAFAVVTRRVGFPFIWTIAVRPDCRGRGLGKMLVREIEWWAQSLNEAAIELTVKTSNPAQKLYFDAGYRVVRFLRNYYIGGGDGLLMRRKLR